MTKYAFLIPLILLLAGFTQTPTTIAESQDEWQWSVVEVVSTASTDTILSSSITSDSMGNLHLVWSDNTFNLADGGDYDIFYKKWDITTKVWGNTKSLTTESTEDSTSPSIMSDSMDNLHVIWSDSTNYTNAGTDTDTFYKMWNSVNQSWGDIEVVSTEGTSNSFNPTFTIDESDDIHVVWDDSTDIDGAGTDRDIFYKNKNVSTGIWGDTEVISLLSTDTARGAKIDSDFLGNIHVIWEDYTATIDSGEDLDIFYKKLDYSTRIWSTTDLVSTVSTAISGYQTIFVDDSGNIHVAWTDSTDYDGSGSDNDILYTMWDITEEAWSITEIVSSESSSGSLAPSMIGDGTTIHIVWQDYTHLNGAGDDPDIFYKGKDNEWSTTTTLISATTEDSRSPRITIDRSQFLHVTWIDETNYSNSGVDKDILYRKFSGVPQVPVLIMNEPNPSSGVISLQWDKDWSANSYHIYRNIYPIYSADGLKSIATTSETHYVDELEVGGTYYYAITANNPEGSTLSNTVYATVEIGDDTVTETITDTVTEDNNITSIFTELATEYLNNTNSDESAASFPLSVPLLFGSITLIIVIQRKRK